MPKEDSNFEATGKLALSTCYLALALVVSGFTMSVLWAWFVAPVFEIRELRLAESIGLVIFASAFKSTKKPKDDEDLWDLCKRHCSSLIGEVVALLGVGYIVHLFI